MRIDEWEADDDIDEVHVELTRGQVGEPGYGIRHSQGCLFALYRREQVRWEAGLGPETQRRRQVGLYRDRGPEVSVDHKAHQPMVGTCERATRELP